MSSMITLGIGRMEIDWGKNSSFRDHSVLFRTSDVKPIPYYYVDMDSDETIIELKEGYSRKLSNMKKRLDLLGYDLASIRKMFEDSVWGIKNMVTRLNYPLTYFMMFYELSIFLR